MLEINQLGSQCLARLITYDLECEPAMTGLRNYSNRSPFPTKAGKTDQFAIFFSAPLQQSRHMKAEH